MKQSTIFGTVIFTSVMATALVGCGSDSPGTLDAAKVVDGAAAFTSEVPCGGATVTTTVTAPAFAYTISPSSSITVNQVVKFEMVAGTSHDVNSNGKGFDTGFGVTKCFKFNVAGSYTFKCTPHGFTGTIVVQ